MATTLLKNITIQNPFENAYISDILIDENKILDIQPDIQVVADKIIDCNNKIITPAMIDRHTHGGYDCNFNTCTEDELQNYLLQLLKHGITSVLPTIMTDSIENINKQINLIKNIKSKGAKISGIHLEGPFINPSKKGIHPQEHILLPTIENLNKIDTDFIKVLTYAPELDPDFKFLNELKYRNIIPSLGHSECDYNYAIAAFKQGINQLTHTFNAMLPIHHRKPSVITAALNDDNINLEIIADLQHVHKAILEMVFKLKPKDKILLISDALPISYSYQKETIFGGEQVFYDGQKATSKDGVLAGSTLFLDDIYKKISDFVEFKDFIGYTTINIYNSLDLHNFSYINIGKTLNYTIWDKETFNVEKMLL